MYAMQNGFWYSQRTISALANVSSLLQRITSCSRSKILRTVFSLSAPKFGDLDNRVVLFIG